jgi:hypothetical protein
VIKEDIDKKNLCALLTRQLVFTRYRLDSEMQFDLAVGRYVVHSLEELADERAAIENVFPWRMAEL